MAITVERMGTDTAAKRNRLGRELHPETGNKGWYREATGRDGGFFAIARDSSSGLVVGYVHWMENRTRGFQPDVTVYGLYGTPKAGLKGVGRALLAEVASVAREQGAAMAVSGMVTSARGFYEAVGATTVPHSKTGRWDDAARDRLADQAVSGRNAASLAGAGTGNS